MSAAAAESFAAVLWFWTAFQFSVGPWWLAYMATAKTASAAWLTRNIGVYMFAGWLPFIAASAGIARILGGLHSAVLIGMHFFGGAFMLYLAYKTAVSAKKDGAGGADFNWKAMTILVWSNPKAWLSIPAGSLAADFSASEAANIAAFALLGVPVYLAAAVFWAAVARQGARIAGDKKMSFANAFLLAGFALYLIAQGVRRAAEYGGV
ncbi:MAG: hypothetical protein ACR2QC_08170 [Gammaproteobacteria bacterium]